MSWLRRLKTKVEMMSTPSSLSNENEEQVDGIIEELKNELSEAQVRMATYGATVNELRNRSVLARERADRRRDEAKLAVLNHDDHAARLALTEERSLRQQCQDAELAWRQAEDALVQMRTHVAALESQISELGNRRDEYRARIRTAELAKLTADLKAGIDERSRIWQRMEENVVRVELEASAHEEVAGLSKELVQSTEASTIETMLAELKTVLDEEPPTK